jgi:RNA polymerase sigma factor (sigma-70 family)
MTETPQNGCDDGRKDAVERGAALDDWFAREILPLEAALMQYLNRNWRNKADIADLRQDVYVRVYEAALKQIPVPARPFVFTVARNLLVDRLRRAHIVPIEGVADVDALGLAMEAPGPERSAIARDELRRLQAAMERLPPRCREAVMLGRIQGMARSEIAARMGVSEDTVTEHLTKGMRALANILYGEPDELWRNP